MLLNFGTENKEDSETAPSREEIENLCILHAVGTDGYRSSELAARLGLSEALADAVAESIQPLISKGWLDTLNDQISLTVAGHNWLEDRLSALGAN